MAIVALMDPEASVPLQVRWALWFARAKQSPLTLLLPSTSSGASRSPDVVLAQVQKLVAKDDAFDYGDADAEDDGDRLLCHLETADAEEPRQVFQAVQKASPSWFLVLLRKVDPKLPRVNGIGTRILPQVTCAVGVIDLGDEHWPVPHLMVAASRGAHPRMALQLARDLVRANEGKLTGVYVEPDIGSDASSVGRRVVDQVVERALGDDADGVARHVVVARDVESGLQQAVEDKKPDAIVLGLPRPGLLNARFFGLVPARICKRVDTPVVILRQAMPLGNRVGRLLEAALQRLIPQVERDTRVELATRVQSSSAWNFDFVALLSLSSVIAALGLLQNSAAVIIGAMLIAPLMTPILGVGLALAQANVVLARMAFRSIGLGVGTAFLLALLVGVVDRQSHAALTLTEEMLARGWPGLIDLLIAFASGLAAAYAHSRPGLIAALPGVAIAAALVPPIATSGLATAAGEFDLAYGSFLLFFTNMVAIVLAAGLSLWSVGVRGQETGRWTRHVVYALVALTLLLAVHLTQRPHLGARVALPNQLDAAIANVLPAGHRLIGVGAVQRAGFLEVVVTVGGKDGLPSSLAQQLLSEVSGELPGKLRVRVVQQFESFADGGR